VVADNDAALARTTAERFGRKVYNLREELRLPMPSIDEALASLESLDGLVVLAETADNPGGGAPGDNTALLEALLARGVTRAAIGAFWDPVTATACAEAGEGALLDVRLGGKCGPASGRPLDLTVRVRAVRETFQQTGLGGSTVDMGLTVLLQSGGVAIVVNSVRTQVFHPDAFTGLGLDLADLNLVAVKSSQHFQTGFGPIADHIIRVSSPGALNFDFATIAYAKRRNLNYFPRVADPLGAP
jgi:microcystin degradation protein MlrC